MAQLMAREQGKEKEKETEANVLRLLQGHTSGKRKPSLWVSSLKGAITSL